jgi:hypothetical protein
LNAAAKVLDRLHNVKQTRPGKWAAGCPCCESKRGRPISIREVDDRILIHPFCGCTTEAVLSTLGLSLADLYDAPLGQQFAPSKSRVPARDLLELVSYEVDVAVIILAEVIDGKTIDETGWQRLAAAARRIGTARDHARGG